MNAERRAVDANIPAATPRKQRCREIVTQCDVAEMPGFAVTNSTKVVSASVGRAWRFRKSKSGGQSTHSLPHQ